MVTKTGLKKICTYALIILAVGASAAHASSRMDNINKLMKNLDSLTAKRDQEIERIDIKNMKFSDWRIPGRLMGAVRHVREGKRGTLFEFLQEPTQFSDAELQDLANLSQYYYDQLIAKEAAPTSAPERVTAASAGGKSKAQEVVEGTIDRIIKNAKTLSRKSEQEISDANEALRVEQSSPLRGSNFLIFQLIEPMREDPSFEDYDARNIMRNSNELHFRTRELADLNDIDRAAQRLIAYFERPKKAPVAASVQPTAASTTGSPAPAPFRQHASARAAVEPTPQAPSRTSAPAPAAAPKMPMKAAAEPIGVEELEAAVQRRLVYLKGIDDAIAKLTADRKEAQTDVDRLRAQIKDLKSAGQAEVARMRAAAKRIQDAIAKLRENAPIPAALQRDIDAFFANRAFERADSKVFKMLKDAIGDAAAPHAVIAD